MIFIILQRIRRRARQSPPKILIRTAGEERVKEAVAGAVKPFANGGDAIHMDNTMLYVTATI